MFFSFFFFLLISAGVNGLEVPDGLEFLTEQNAPELDIFTAPHEFPWMVSIEAYFSRSNITFHCGASLISSRWILTTANCVVANGRRASVVIASIGKFNIGINTEPREIKQYISSILIHPHFTVNGWGEPESFDFALLKLNYPVEITPQVRPIELPDEYCLQTRYSNSSSIIDSCRMATVASWNPISIDVEENILKKIRLPIQPFIACSITMSDTYFSISKICAGGEDATPRSCLIGDAGDPLMCYLDESWYHIGSLSFRNTTSCVSRLEVPRVFSRTCAALPWIRSVTGLQNTKRKYFSFFHQMLLY